MIPPVVIFGPAEEEEEEAAGFAPPADGPGDVPAEPWMDAV